jgi:hypothetical protein
MQHAMAVGADDREVCLGVEDDLAGLADELSLNPPGLRVFCDVLAGQEPSSIRRALHPQGERPQLQECPITRPDERLQRRHRVDSRAT